MEIKPIKNSREPNYPTIELFIKHPELLSKSIPNNWVKNKFVAASLAAFLVSGSGTIKAQTSEKVETVEPSNSQKLAESPQKKKQNNNNITNVAPVFAHGEGSGATGCIVFSPPVFLSEDEALNIILKALSLEGYNNFSTTNVPIYSLKVPNLANCDKGEQKMTTIKLRTDTYDKKSKWTIQFISADDFSKFITNDGCQSSVMRYNTKLAAEAVRNELLLKKETNAVVFYDPVLKNRGSINGLEIAKSEAKEMLIQQVYDFIDWLKTNNIKIE